MCPPTSGTGGCLRTASTRSRGNFSTFSLQAGGKFRKAFSRNDNVTQCSADHLSSKSEAFSGIGDDHEIWAEIRLRPSSRGALEWRISAETVGTVICRYQVHSGSPRAAERVDVQFNPKTIVWGRSRTNLKKSQNCRPNNLIASFRWMDLSRAKQVQRDDVGR